MENKLLWSADKARKKKSSIKNFADKISQKYKIDFSDDFLKLHDWSIKNPSNFWSEYWDYANIIGKKGNQIIDSDKVFYKNKFFSDSKINFAENLLIKNNNDIAIHSLKENGLNESVTWKELREKVFKISSFLNKIGLVKNDRVAAYVPNVIETVISFLAAAKNGCIWS
ncbi:MAG: acetoacetate--CoA ligase, partial [Opitutae bacterium]|nr:acetoacetate--CoA ligase [Opitutae bacterium]